MDFYYTGFLLRNKISVGKNEQFTYMWSEKSGVLVTLSTPQLQEVIVIPRCLISLATMRI